MYSTRTDPYARTCLSLLYLSSHVRSRPCCYANYPLSSLRAPHASCGRATQTTIVATLLQPSPEVVACFHDVILLSQGVIAYHGPTERLAPFLGSLGLAANAEAGQTMADFAQVRVGGWMCTEWDELYLSGFRSLWYAIALFRRCASP